MTAYAVTEGAELRRWAARQSQRRRAIVLQAGPTHAEFGSSFMRYYLPHYCSEAGEWIDSAEWHDAFYHAVFTSLGTQAADVHIAPRGYAKSTTVTLALPLIALGLKLKNYIWIVQDTGEQARQAMENILSETEGNPRIAADFPHLSPAVGPHSRPLVDRDTDVVFASDQRLQAFGAGMKLRGRRHRQHRPDLCLIDDLENDEHVLTKYQRDKLDNWFSSALLPALGKDADLHVVGTILHNDALLARLRGRSGWRTTVYPALRNPDDPDSTTWSYRDGAWHRKMRERMGSLAYSREILHIVTDENRKRFPSASFRYAGSPVGDGARCRIGVDPAVSQKQTADRSAVVVALRERGKGRYHVEEAWADRVRGATLKRRIVEVYRDYKERGYAPIVVAEAVQAQEWLAQELEDEGIPVKAVRPTVDKLTRAEPVALHYEQGRVTHSEALRGSDFEAELDSFPDGIHDDLVDALVYAVTELQDEPGAGVAGVVTTGPSREQDAPADPRYS